jgi:hypothetical protein
MKPRAGEVSLFDCLWLTLLTMGALAVGILAAERWGWPGAFLGLIVGFFGILGALYAILVVVALIERRWFPRCHQGICRGDWQTTIGDYTTVRFGEDEFGYRCRCGIEYIKKDRRFMLLRPDGTLGPYMIWTWPHGYVHDEQV